MAARDADAADELLLNLDGKAATEDHSTISRKGVYRHGTVILSLSEESACRYHTQTKADASLCSA